MQSKSLWVTLGAASLTFLIAACHVIDHDYFDCGVLEEGGGVRRCDGPGELCLCQEHRCAVTSSACTSNFRYLFGPKDEVQCVDRDKLMPQVGPASSRSFCPGEGELPVVCGGPAPDGGYMGCPSTQFCICATRMCAMLDPSCADAGTGMRYSSLSSSSCVGDLGDVNAAVARSDNSCPGFRPNDVFKDAGTSPNPAPTAPGGAR